MSSKEAVNPFMANIPMARLSAVKCYSTQKYITPDNIKIEDGMALPKVEDSFAGADLNYSFLIDRVSKCSFYQTDSTAEIIKKLDGNGRTMFLYIQYAISKDSEAVLITQKGYEGFSGKSSSRTFYSGVNQLIKTAVIQRKTTNTYWVNPFVIFNGSRIDKYPENVDIVAKVRLREQNF